MLLLKTIKNKYSQKVANTKGKNWKAMYNVPNLAYFLMRYSVLILLSQVFVSIHTFRYCRYTAYIILPTPSTWSHILLCLYCYQKVFSYTTLNIEWYLLNISAREISKWQTLQTLLVTLRTMVCLSVYVWRFLKAYAMSQFSRNKY